ncbi:MAG: hypothetical protein ACK5OV_02835, partial [bacterium]
MLNPLQDIFSQSDVAFGLPVGERLCGFTKSGSKVADQKALFAQTLDEECVVIARANISGRV